MSIARRLRERGLHPKKRFGQNFLTDEHACRSIAAAATTPPGGTVVEIGPGLGALTRHLVERAAHVFAIEYDSDLVGLLAEEYKETIEQKNFSLIEADALDVAWLDLLAGGPAPHTVAGNLPYLITGRLLERAVTIAHRIDRAVFMVQAEVASRLVAEPGTEAYGGLTVFVQAAFAPRRILTVRGGAFYPKPDVDSAVVELLPHKPRRAEETDAFRAAVRAAFGARRKTLRNAWKGLYGWSKEELEIRAAEANVSLDARGETLAVEDFARLASLAPSGRSPHLAP